MKNSKYLLSYVDFYLYYFVLFAGLFALIYLSPEGKNSEGNTIDPAQFLIELTWEEGSPNDLDLWVKAPDNSITFFRHKDSNLVTLDRDDLGINNSTTTENGVVVVNTQRREVASIRKVIPGTYTVNVMMFKNRNNKTEHPKVTIRRLNPYMEVIDKTIELTTEGEEATIINFDLDTNGNVSDVNDVKTSLFNMVE